MSKRSKKRKGSGKKTTLHYFVHLLDREAWGSSTMCGKKGSGTWDSTKATCKECMKHTNWSLAQCKRMAARPLMFCGACDAGAILVKDVREDQWLAICNSCCIQEWRDR